MNKRFVNFLATYLFTFFLLDISTTHIALKVGLVETGFLALHYWALFGYTLGNIIWFSTVGSATYILYKGTQAEYKQVQVFCATCLICMCLLWTYAITNNIYWTLKLL